MTVTIPPKSTEADTPEKVQSVDDLVTIRRTEKAITQPDQEDVSAHLKSALDAIEQIMFPDPIGVTHIGGGKELIAYTSLTVVESHITFDPFLNVVVDVSGNMTGYQPLLRQQGSAKKFKDIINSYEQSFAAFDAIRSGLNDLITPDLKAEKFDASATYKDIQEKATGIYGQLMLNEPLQKIRDLEKEISEHEFSKDDTFHMGASVFLLVPTYNKAVLYLNDNRESVVHKHKPAFKDEQKALDYDGSDKISVKIDAEDFGRYVGLLHLSERSRSVIEENPEIQNAQLAYLRAPNA